MRPIRPTSVLLALLFPLLQFVTRPVSAAEPAKPWKALFTRCQKLSNEGDYKGGLEACEKAYELNPDPGILAYMAQIHTALLQPVQAREMLERYLHSSPLDEANRKTAEAQLRYLETLLGTLLVSTPLEAAEIRVDDQVTDRNTLAQGVRLTIGAHRVTLQDKGGATFSRFVVLRAGERTQLELPGNGSIALSCAIPGVQSFIDEREVDSAQASNGVPCAAGSHRVTFKVGGGATSEQTVVVNPDERIVVGCAAPRPTPVSVTPPTMNSRGYWLTGTGVALGVAALATAFYNGHQYDKWETTNESLRDRSLTFDQSKQMAQENNQLMESIQTTRKVAVGLGIASGLVTAGGVALLFADSRRPAQTAASSWFRTMVGGLTVSPALTSGEVAWRGAW
jgi:hypothetical protein